MCGFCGIVSLFPKRVDEDVLLRMNSKIVHRGPDMSGIWQSNSGAIKLGHRRLSIHDLSSAGHQPMESQSKNSVIAFNGEIYNFEDLKVRLIDDFDLVFNGKSDTEVLCEYIEHYGIDNTLADIVGMFAFAYYDQSTNKLFICRDRAGEKPLYYWLDDTRTSIYFASEMKSLLAGIPVNISINNDVLSEYFSFSYVAAPRTIVNGVFKLSPATVATIDLNSSTLKIDIKSYWQVPQRSADLSFEEAKDTLKTLLTNSVKRQLVADVPVGAFLSGGVDSSLIVAVAQSLSDKPIKTFTIGFDDDKYNEANDAKLISEHLGTEHNQLYLSSKDILDHIPELVKSFDEPCGDVSLIPTQLLAKFTKQQVTVSLSGDGGDELFWGYSRYQQATKLWEKTNKIHRLIKPFSRLIDDVHLGNKIPKILGVLGSDSLVGLYRKKKSHWLFYETPHEFYSNEFDSLAKDDFCSYLPDDILFKVDRACMSVSLEGRIPFLDRDIVEFAYSLPHAFKCRNGEQKYILKEVLYDFIPREVMDRPKKGFNLPLSKWLKNELSDWATQLIKSSKLKHNSIIPHKKITKMLEDHIAGRKDNTYLLWDYIVITLWLNEYIS